VSQFQVGRRILGVDYGKARIGVAMSDELRMLAHPVETVPAQQLDKAAKRIAEIATTNDVEKVILGLPKHMSGESGVAAAEAKAFADKLRPLLKCEIVMWDERLTTTAANRALRESGKSTRRTRGVVDQVAAQMILQGYLDSQQISGPEGGLLP
jgi:putative holliday junction resolvase